MAQPADPTTPGQAAASAQDHSATPHMQLNDRFINVPLLATRVPALCRVALRVAAAGPQSAGASHLVGVLVGDAGGQ